MDHLRLGGKAEQALDRFDRTTVRPPLGEVRRRHRAQQRDHGHAEAKATGDAATDSHGTEATSWEGLKDVLEEESTPHTVLPVPAKA